MHRMCAGFQDALLATARRGQSKPVIVNVNSYGGRIPLRNMAAYSASKFALAGESADTQSLLAGSPASMLPETLSQAAQQMLD